jgi:hypothetical protein
MSAVSYRNEIRGRAGSSPARRPPPPARRRRRSISTTRDRSGGPQQEAYGFGPCGDGAPDPKRPCAALCVGEGCRDDRQDGWGEECGSSPCNPRPATSMPDDCARPLSSDPAESSKIPGVNTRLRPRGSPARPPSSRKPPKISVCMLITRCRFGVVKRRPRWIDGRAILTTAQATLRPGWRC